MDKLWRNFMSRRARRRRRNGKWEEEEMENGFWKKREIRKNQGHFRNLTKFHPKKDGRPQKGWFCTLLNSSRTIQKKLEGPKCHLLKSSGTISNINPKF